MSRSIAPHQRWQVVAIRVNVVVIIVGLLVFAILAVTQ